LGLSGLNLYACGWEQITLSSGNGEETTEFHKIRDFSGIAKEPSRSRN